MTPPRHGGNVHRLGGATPEGAPPAHGRARAVMVQGVCSNVGKSVIATALCRILLQDGYRVAPFKAQNLSLNSFVTRDGLEMGRAQATQARACRLAPDVRMNPVLLKPSSETGCQVIVRGRPVGFAEALDYGERSRRLFGEAKACYDALAAEYDVIVLEGAGSPAEVNLKDRDFVNMRMARHADAPVLIVGDIDRGGVFAFFIGVMETFEEWERRLVAGFVVNRFHGDEALLGDAFEYVERHTGKPTFGVIPFLPDLGLPEEDSVEFKAGAYDDAATRPDAVTVAVVDLPHISNFTDLDALRGEPDVAIRVARAPEDLAGADAVVLPGSKNTLGDLAWLRHTGLAAEIERVARSGAAEVVGLCGGFQMLGREVSDPAQVESRSGRVEGLGLLDARTELAAGKTLRQATARHLPSGLEVRGYEIHHGRTETGDETAAIRADDGGVLGVAGRVGRVWGTYLHGVFDADAFRRWFVDGLRVRRGLPGLGEVVAPYDLEPALDRLAEVVRERLDLSAIYRRMGLA